MPARTFEYKVYGTNGETPRQHAVSQMNASREAQNNLAQSGGDKVIIPQFASKGAGPDDSNKNIQRLAHAQLKLDNTAQLQSNTGSKIHGGSRRRNKNRHRSTKHKMKITKINFI